MAPVHAPTKHGKVPNKRPIPKPKLWAKTKPAPRDRMDPGIKKTSKYGSEQYDV